MFWRRRTISITDCQGANPFLDAAIAAEFEEGYFYCGRAQDFYERNLLAILLRRVEGVKTVLEIGSGTGHFTRWFGEMRYRATGVETAPAMLERARQLGGEATYVEGDAMSLPFRDRSFDVAALITTLEFLADPGTALAEAVRVSRRAILIGAMNRLSPFGWRRRQVKQRPVWRLARRFTPGELVRLVRAAAGDRLDGLRWRTTPWPFARFRHLPLPWGGFIGLVAKLNEVGTDQ